LLDYQKKTRLAGSALCQSCDLPCESQGCARRLRTHVSTRSAGSFSGSTPEADMRLSIDYTQVCGSDRSGMPLYAPREHAYTAYTSHAPAQLLGGSSALTISYEGRDRRRPYRLRELHWYHDHAKMTPIVSADERVGKGNIR
jgi:hypothetical protein